MHPFFLLIVNPEILFSRFLPCYKILLLFNEYANDLYRRNWNRPVNPVQPCPWFYWGERQTACLTTPVLWLLPMNSQHLKYQFPITLIFKFLLEVVAIQRKNFRDWSRQLFKNAVSGCYYFKLPSKSTVSWPSSEPPRKVVKKTCHFATCHLLVLQSILYF